MFSYNVPLSQQFAEKLPFLDSSSFCPEYQDGTWVLSCWSVFVSSLNIFPHLLTSCQTSRSSLASEHNVWVVKAIVHSSPCSLCLLPSWRPSLLSLKSVCPSSAPNFGRERTSYPRPTFFSSNKSLNNQPCGLSAFPHKYLDLWW